MVIFVAQMFRTFLRMNYTHFKLSLLLSIKLLIGQGWKTFSVSLCNLLANYCFFSYSKCWRSLKNKWAIKNYCMLILKWQEVIQLTVNYVCITCDVFCSRAFILCSVKGFAPMPKNVLLLLIEMLILNISCWISKKKNNILIATFHVCGSHKTAIRNCKKR